MQEYTDAETTISFITEKEEDSSSTGCVYVAVVIGWLSLSEIPKIWLKRFWRGISQAIRGLRRRRRPRRRRTWVRRRKELETLSQPMNIMSGRQDSKESTDENETRQIDICHLSHFSLMVPDINGNATDCSGCQLVDYQSSALVCLCFV